MTSSVDGETQILEPRDGVVKKVFWSWSFVFLRGCAFGLAMAARAAVTVTDTTPIEYCSGIDDAVASNFLRGEI